jgi:predicted oxidoreductase
VVAPFERRVREGVRRGLVTFGFRHRVNDLVLQDGAVTGVRGELLEASGEPRGVTSSRVAVGEFDLTAQAVVVTSGGIGGNHELVRKNWPARLGQAPANMLTGVPAHVDGRMLGITEAAGGNIVNRDRMWHYTEGVTNHTPIWPGHGIRILPAPSSLWLDATGKRLPGPLFPGFDTLGTLEHIMGTGHDYTWFVLTQKIIEREFTLSGSEQNPDLTDKDFRKLLKRILPGSSDPVRAFQERGADFVNATSVGELVGKMNALTDQPLLDAAQVERVIVERDREIGNRFTKDAQITAIRAARTYRADKLTRVASPHALLDPKAGPLIAVKLHIVTRKTLGGLETDLDGRVLAASGEPIPGLYAAGEVSGFGGGGVHGYRSLEGTFLGGCIFSGRQAGRAVAGAVA